MSSIGSGNILRDGGHVFYTSPTGGGRNLLSYEGPGGEVKVPEGVVCVCGEAFAWCTHVTKVILPEGVWLIGRKAFFGSGIRSISLPGTMKRIEELAFTRTPLTEISIPDGTEHVESRAFFEAAGLIKAGLPEGITSLEPAVFSGCVSLRDVSLPASLKYIQGRAFENCAALERIRLPEGLTVVWTRAFSGCRSLKEVYLGDNVGLIGYGAFSGCTLLEKLRIPEGLKMTDGDAFGDAGRVELTGPGAARGLLISQDPAVYYFPGEEKAVIPEGTEKFPESCSLWERNRVKVLELPGSLKTYSWYYLAQIGDLKRIVSDKGAFGPEIAHLLDAECVNKKGRKRRFRAPVRLGKWVTEPDKANKGLRITGHKGHIGEAGTKEYLTLLIPGRIKGKPVTSVGAGAFADRNNVGAVCLPDTVRRIESGAFARCGYDMVGGRTLFLRMPDHVSFASGAFEGTECVTRKSVLKARERLCPKPQEAPGGAPPENRFASGAADDPAIGTGTEGRPALRANIWQYLDRLTRKERVRALTHSFTIQSGIDGAGWASVRIELDGDKARFRISCIGNSPADFRRFAEEIGDGENEGFAWSSEPGCYPWRIQRRGGIFYVNAPEIADSFFISRAEFLEAVKNLTAEWRR